MAWVDIPESKYKKVFNCPAGIDADEHVYVTLQYSDNPEYLSPTSARIRFKLNTATGTNYYDKFYLLIGQSEDGTLQKIKDVWGGDGSGKWPFHLENGFNITKSYTAATFTIPSYYIIDNGNNAVTISNAKEAYKAATNTRKNYSCAISSEALEIAASETKATAVTAGSVSIKDNYNNSYTVSGTGGNAGTNNPVTSATLSYTNETGNTATVDCKGKTVAKIIAFTPADKNATKNVTASVDTKGTYNDPAKVSKTVAIRQYVGPNQPTNHKISYNKNRFTLKENWTLSWTAPAINNECPIKGYRIRLYRKRGTGSWIKLPIYNSSGGMGHVTGIASVSPTDYYWDRDGTSTSVTIYTKYYNKEVIPNYEDILPGDIVKFAVTAYTKYGANYDGNKVFKTGESFSSEYTVQNAGIMRVKVGSAWKEGQVYVKTSGGWKEADVVNIKTASGWQESE